MRDNHRRRGMLGAAGGLLTALALLGGLNGSAYAATADAADAAQAAAAHDVVTWAASADRTNADFTEQTVRLVVHTSVGGSGLRLRLSNAFGSRPVSFGGVYVGVRATGPAVVPGTNRGATFGGTRSLTIPVGAEAESDPLPGSVPAGTDLTVSLYLRGESGTVTGHNLALETSYVSTVGDHAADEGGEAFTTTRANWFWLDSLTVAAPRTVDTVAALGDSITDGVGSTAGTNQRWPDLLARRLTSGPQRRRTGVANEGISGNKVLADGAGVSAQARLDRDVLSQAGVRTVVLLEGINDIRGDDATAAEDLVAAYRQIIARVHATGRCVVGGTLTPFQGDGAFTPEREAVRAAVNHFIRTSGEFDGVVDFDRATRDPRAPQRFLPLFDSGDHLHPNDAGYHAMADAVDPHTLAC